MENLKESELVSCSICLTDYSIKDNCIAMTTKCSHTFCRNCLDKFIKKSINNSFECPTCRTLIKYNPNSEINNNDNEKEVWENKILNSILNSFDPINNLFDINVEPLLSIKLNFYYCKNCNMFISNYTLNSQNNNNLTEKHSINSLFKYSYSFFKNIRKKSIYSFTDTEKLFMSLYYFYSQKINKFEFTVKRKISINSGEYSFYGQILEVNSKNEFLMNIIQTMLQNNIQEKNYAKLFKGILSKTNFEFKIHGIFYIIQNKGEFIIHNAFGLYNYNNDLFFGFIKINENNEINFDCGILYCNYKYFFGIFSYDDNIKNELKMGEIIYNNENKSEIVNNLKEKEIPQEEPVLILNNDTYEKIVITPLKLLDRNKLFSDITINECKIFYLKFNFSIIFSNNMLNSFLLVNESLGEKNMESICVYSCNITVKISTGQFIIDKLRNYKIKEINKNKNEFIDYINRLVAISLNDCEIYYKLEKLNNILNNEFFISGKYYSIYSNEEKVLYKENNEDDPYYEKEYKNFKLKHSKIKDLFNIFDDNNKNSGFNQKIKTLSTIRFNRSHHFNCSCLVN